MSWGAFCFVCVQRGESDVRHLSCRRMNRRAAAAFLLPYQEAELVEKSLANFQQERIGQFRASLLGAGTESLRRYVRPVFPHIDDLAGTEVPGFDLGYGFTDRGFRNPDAERPPFE